GRVVYLQRGQTTPRVSAIEMPTTDLGLLYNLNPNFRVDRRNNPGWVHGQFHGSSRAIGSSIIQGKTFQTFRKTPVC
ncbi:hypothetical protein, partial [Prochlorothrix hollandica]|uniref:hypothetical protein n=1 Tax=Prochlorothrix hollandica TaxID=1223 RepID=UPI003340F5BB